MNRCASSANAPPTARRGDTSGPSSCRLCAWRPEPVLTLPARRLADMCGGRRECASFGTKKGMATYLGCGEPLSTGALALGSLGPSRSCWCSFTAVPVATVCDATRCGTRDAVARAGTLARGRWLAAPGWARGAALSAAGVAAAPLNELPTVHTDPSLSCPLPSLALHDGDGLGTRTALVVDARAPCRRRAAFRPAPPADRCLLCPLLLPPRPTLDGGSSNTRSCAGTDSTRAEPPRSAPLSLACAGDRGASALRLPAVLLDRSTSGCATAALPSSGMEWTGYGRGCTL